jgi:membrane protein DedA with SNARE-associated domain
MRTERRFQETLTPHAVESRFDAARREKYGPLVLAGIGATTALAAAGTILTPALSTSHPLLLLWLDPADRNLLLVHRVALGPFLVVGTVRRLVADPLFYLAGRWYGPGGFRNVERALGRRSGQLLERAFRRGAYPTLVAFMGRVVSALAGTVGVPPVRFGIIALARTVMAVVAFRWLGGVFAPEVDVVLRVFTRDLLLLTGLIVATMALAALAARRS